MAYPRIFDNREFIDEVAAEVVLQLVVDGDIVVSPVSVAAVEHEVATRIFQAPPGEKHRFDIRAPRRASREDGWTEVLAVVQEIIGALRLSCSVDRLLADDAALVRKILSVMTRVSAPRGSPKSFGGMGSPPRGTGSPGGCPAEVRAWEVRPGEIPREPDPERQERGKKRWKR